MWPAWIQFEFPKPQSIRSVTIASTNLDIVSSVIFGVSNQNIFLEASDDGQTFLVIQDIPEGGAPEHTVSFPAVEAKYFRVSPSGGLRRPRPRRG